MLKQVQHDTIDKQKMIIRYFHDKPSETNKILI